MDIRTSTFCDILRDLAKPLFDYSMKGMSSPHDDAFQVWFSLRDIRALIMFRGSLDLSQDERAELIRACGMAHYFQHIGLGAETPGVDECPCNVAKLLRVLAVLLAHGEIGRALELMGVVQ